MEILENLISINTFIALAIGIVGGMVVGALPGLSATMGVALLIPMTYGMDPAAALIMLCAVYTSAVYGGSITAILIHTPGTPNSAATAIDGYELTLQGKGLKAIGVSTISSTIGGVVSALALLLIAPPLSRIALNFSAPEYFLLAIFGLTIIGSVSSDSMLKGLTVATLGLLFATIGLSLTGYPRFTFGSLYLRSGIPLIPALIGLFSMSQVLLEVSKRHQAGKPKDKIGEVKGSFWPTKKEFKQISPTIIRSTIIGIFTGILPGAGGDIASWIGYNEAKRFSKHKEEFGKGSIEGVAGPEAANNAVTGGALIPTLTLGIPGSATAAVLLGGLTIQGLVPGYGLFSRYADITYTIMYGFLAANILMGIAGYFIAKQVVKVTRIPTGVLMPLITVFSVVGSYSINNNMSDVYVMIVFGILGYFMQKRGFPTAPVVLSLILGPLAEKNLALSLEMAKVHWSIYFLSRPICVILLILIISSVVVPLLSKKKSAKKEQIQIGK